MAFPTSLPDSPASRAKNRRPYGREYPVSLVEGNFLTIGAAIAAAVADGHGPSSPAIVRIYPGVYTEDVTLVSGIHLRAVAPFSKMAECDDGPTKIVGKLTYATTDTGGVATNFVVVDGLYIDPDSDEGVDFSGGESQELILRNCVICGDGSTITDGSIELANTWSTGTAGDRSAVVLDNCLVRQKDQISGVRAVYATSGDLFAFRTTFRRGDGVDTTTIEVNGTTAGLSNISLDDDCVVFGAFEQFVGLVANSDGGAHVFRNTKFDSGAASIICGRDGSVTADDLILKCMTAGFAVDQAAGAETNTNLFIYTDLIYTDEGRGIDPGVRCILNAEVPANRFLPTPVGFGLSTTRPNDFVTVVGDPAIGSTIRLPPTGLNSTVPSSSGTTALPGTVVEVKEQGGGIDGSPLSAPITVTGATGVEPVDGGTSFDFQTYGQYAKFTVNEAGTGWLVSGGYRKDGTTYIEVDTTDATPSSTVLYDLPADRDAVYLRGVVTARASAADDKVLQTLFEGTFIRTDSAGAYPANISIIGLTNTISLAVGFVFTTAIIGTTGGAANEITMTVTGEAGTSIAWTICIEEARILR